MSKNAYGVYVKQGTGESGIILPGCVDNDVYHSEWTREELTELVERIFRDADRPAPVIKYRSFQGRRLGQARGLEYKLVISCPFPSVVIHESAHLLAGVHNGHNPAFQGRLQNLWNKYGAEIALRHVRDGLVSINSIQKGYMIPASREGSVTPKNTPAVVAEPKRAAVQIRDTKTGILYASKYKAGVALAPEVGLDGKKDSWVITKLMKMWPGRLVEVRTATA